MFTMRFWLRVMLGSLAVAALLGVLAVLTGGDWVIGRVAGTGVALALSSAAIMPMTLLVDRQRWRAAGLFGMAVILAGFFCCLLATWWPRVLAPQGYYWSVSEAFWITMGIVLGVGLPATALLAMTRVSVLRWSGLAGLGVAALAALLFLAAAWWGVVTNWRNIEWKLFSTGWAVCLLGLVAVVALVGAGTPAGRRPWRWLGVAASLVALLIITCAIWWEIDESTGLVEATVSLAVFVALANLLMAIPLKPGQVWLRWATLAAAAACTVLVDMMVIDAIADALPADVAEGLWRFIGATGILAGCGTLAMLILVRLNRSVDWEKGVSGLPGQISLHCPRCRKKQTLPLGDSICPTCRLRFHIRVEEPRCRNCGYLLLMLTSNACPECGQPIDAAPAQAGRSDGSGQPAPTGQ